ncbi:iron complex outermembrane receptor protein/outer membrane receptor for ferric coprogen and ferric-rhodotorulic acid [Acidovorax soli]|uniref:Iron complex outermembrane receptor protein/outer membrane receptor for ferric coprogen and ferric-rhodotorulic acid n=1 Tax=Acidovorax soli TaxID=592050 RepID=A0A7X0PH53_9BURK|nr:TonB-dependent receptor [Acidovorax soli]MBB6561776.1 iron complex outermembrane receptor protein/outer membrane receptor for ferric coprogen and ferric-rhodotorulic acid [Acidovorax soli]
MTASPSRPLRAPAPFAMALSTAAIRAALAGMALSTLAAAPARAADPAPAAATPRTYAIAAGPLSDVLAQFAATAGVQLVFDPAALAGLRSPGLQGSHGTQQGFDLLLRGSGFVAVPQGSSAFALRKASVAPAPIAPGAAAELAPVTVTAQAEAGSTTEGTGSYTTRATGAGTRMELSLRETPQSVSVVGRQQMEDQNLTTMEAALRQAPGIIVNRRDERVDFYARGFALSQMVDGVPTLAYSNVAAEASMSSTAIYDRVEVVRGAAGLLNGVGAPGGSVNMVRKRPTTEFTGSVSAGVGSWNRYAAEADIGGKLNASGSLRGRVVASHLNGDTFTQNKSRREDVLYAIAEADLAPGTVLAAGLEYQDTSIAGANFGAIPLFYNNRTPISVPRSFNSSTSWSTWNMLTQRVFVNLDHRMANGWHLKAEANHLKNERERYSGDIWTSPANINASTQIGTMQLGDNPADGTNKSLDFHATGPYELFGRTHQAVLGFNINRYAYAIETNRAVATGTMIDQRPVNIFNVDAIAKPDFKYPRYYYGAKTEEKAVYASTRLKPTDALSVLLGGRLTWYDNAPWTRIWFSGGTGRPVNGLRTVEDAVFTPYAGVVFDVSRDFSVYASYTDIFQPNTVNDSSGQVLDPQRGTNLELGIKGEHFGGKLNTSFALFETEQDNVPVASGTQPDGSAAYRPAKGTKSRGYEFTAAGEVLPGWQLMGGYSYVTPRKNDGSLLSPHLPARTLRVATTYRLPGDWNRLTLGANLSWQSAIWMNEFYGQGTVAQGGVTVLGLMARYDVNKQLSVSLNVENATDKQYVNLSGFSTYVYGNPRNAWLKASYRF